MQNIKIKELLRSSLAVNELKWEDIWNTILINYKNTNKELELDFSNIRVMIAPFIRKLLKPIYENWITFSWTNFPDIITETMYIRIIKDFEIIGTETLREISI